ncbi:hypothetical protein AB1N83_011734 [Pleurotus pulmonarius]
MCSSRTRIAPGEHGHVLHTLGTTSHHEPHFYTHCKGFYIECVDIDTGSLVGLLSHFKPTNFPDRILFSAALTREGAEARRVFVKLVDRADVRPYGAEVHTHLAARGYAPQLYGHKILCGVPASREEL